MRYEIGIPFLPSYLFGLVIKNIFTYALLVHGSYWRKMAGAYSLYSLYFNST